MIDNEAIHGIVVDQGLSLEEKAARLVDEAKSHGGADNITVILIKGEEGR